MKNWTKNEYAGVADKHVAISFKGGEIAEIRRLGGDSPARHPPYPRMHLTKYLENRETNVHTFQARALRSNAIDPVAITHET